MSVPLDRLYDFLQGVCNRDILIYRWLPHGSRKLEDLKPLHTIDAHYTQPHRLVTTQPMICHDQEPLNYNYWSITDFEQVQIDRFKETASMAHQFAKWHLRSVLSRRHKAHVFGYTLLCHSELQSEQLKIYEQHNFKGVYYWSHALIAQDWYRFAQYDSILNQKKVTHDFLIYNRAWSGTREYRLKLAQLLVESGLVQNCAMKFNPVDQIHYKTYEFNNKALAIDNIDLEQYFLPNQSDAAASADYCSIDYQCTEIEVVLETLFDDTRLHLTEKTLRPIACGQPFILAATPGSLSLLKKYGFKTFDSLWDESYDNIKDPVQRLHSIVKLMTQIRASDNKQELMKKCRAITKHNQQRFFSPQFHKSIVEEFRQNFLVAYDQSRQQCSLTCLDEYIQAFKAHGNYWQQANDQHLATVDADRQYVNDFVTKIKAESNVQSNLMLATPFYSV